MTLAWDANLEPDVAGYRIYYGTAAPFAMLDVGNQTKATLPDLKAGLTYTIFATAYNTAGLESAPSQPIVYKVPLVLMPPTIQIPPVSQRVGAGDPLILAVKANGGALRYLWFKEGIQIPGQTGETFSLPAVTVEDAGAYRVMVYNGLGKVLSLPAQIEVEHSASLTRTTSRGTLELSGTGISGEKYELQRSADLISPSWVTILTLTIDETGKFRLYIPKDPSKPAVFYRVVPVQQQEG